MATLLSSSPIKRRGSPGPLDKGLASRNVWGFAAAILGLLPLAYGLGMTVHARMDRTISLPQVAPAVLAPTVKPVLEHGAKRIAYALAAAQADGKAIGHPSQLVGDYLQDIPAVPGSPGAWEVQGYSLAMPVKAEYCESTFGQPPLPAERDTAGLQCHYSNEGVRLTYRLDPVRPEDKLMYEATLFLALKNNVPWMRLSINGAPGAKCAGTDQQSGVLRLPQDGKPVAIKACLPVYAWEPLKYQMGTILFDSPEALSYEFRGQGQHQLLTATATPLDADGAKAVAWTLSRRTLE